MKTVYDSACPPQVSSEEWDRLDAIRDEDIDFSDIGEQDISSFASWRERHEPPQVKITVSLDIATANSLRSQAAAVHKTPAEVIGEMVRERLAAAG